MNKLVICGSEVILEAYREKPLLLLSKRRQSLAQVSGPRAHRQAAGGGWALGASGLHLELHSDLKALAIHLF